VLFKIYIWTRNNAGRSPYVRLFPGRETFVADDQATFFDIFTLRFLLLVYLTLLFDLSSGYPNSGLA